MSKKTAVIRKALSVILMVTVGSSYCLMTSTAFAQVSPKLAGQLSTRGQVTLNGISTTSGATIFGGNQIKTGANGSATISLGKMGQVDLEPDSELTLRLEAGVIGGHLRSGRATISAPVGIAVNLATTDGVAVADGRQASVLTVDMTSGNTRVASVRSEARVTSGDQVEVVAAGQEVSVGTPGTQTPQTAGGATGGISGAALATLIIVGVVGGVAGIVTAIQGDDKVAGGTIVLSAFR
jgi:hypothetical protein